MLTMSMKSEKAAMSYGNDVPGDLLAVAAIGVPAARSIVTQLGGELSTAIDLMSRRRRRPDH